MSPKWILSLLTAAAPALAASSCDSGTPVDVDPPEIALSSESLSFDGGVLGSSPAPEVLTVSNAGGGALDGLTATVAYAGGQPDGWLEANLEDAEGPTSLTLTPTIGTLPEGAYEATVTVASSGAVEEAQTVSVTLELSHVLDEAYEPEATQVFWGGSWDKAQTFIAGVSGTLTRLEIPLVLQGGDIELSIRATNGGVPTESNTVTLFTETIPASAFDAGAEIQTYDLGEEGIPVLAGQVFTFVMRSESSFQWNGTINDGYPDGGAFGRNPPDQTTWLRVEDQDFPFRTYVTPN